MYFFIFTHTQDWEVGRDRLRARVREKEREDENESIIYLFIYLCIYLSLYGMDIYLIYLIDTRIEISYLSIIYLSISV